MPIYYNLIQNINDCGKMTEADVRQYFNDRHINLKLEWMQSAIGYIKCHEAGKTKNDLCEAVLEQFVHSDLASSSHAALKIPVAATKYVITKQMVFQITSVVNIARSGYSLYREATNTKDDLAWFHGENHEEENNIIADPSVIEHDPQCGRRMLKMKLTDGSNSLEAVESGGHVDIDENTPPGTKVFLFARAISRKGIVIVNSQNMQVLGGDIEDLVKSFDRITFLAERIGIKHDRSKNKRVMDKEKRLEPFPQGVIANQKINNTALATISPFLVRIPRHVTKATDLEERRMAKIECSDEEDDVVIMGSAGPSTTLALPPPLPIPPMLENPIAAPPCSSNPHFHHQTQPKRVHNMTPTIDEEQRTTRPCIAQPASTSNPLRARLIRPTRVSSDAVDIIPQHALQPIEYYKEEVDPVIISNPVIIPHIPPKSKKDKNAAASNGTRPISSFFPEHHRSEWQEEENSSTTQSIHSKPVVPISQLHFQFERPLGLAAHNTRRVVGAGPSVNDRIKMRHELPTSTTERNQHQYSNGYHYEDEMNRQKQQADHPFAPDNIFRRPQDETNCNIGFMRQESRQSLHPSELQHSPVMDYIVNSPTPSFSILNTQPVLSTPQLMRGGIRIDDDQSPPNISRDTSLQNMIHSFTSPPRADSFVTKRYSNGIPGGVLIPHKKTKPEQFEFNLHDNVTSSNDIRRNNHNQQQVGIAPPSADLILIEKYNNLGIILLADALQKKRFWMLPKVVRIMPLICHAPNAVRLDNCNMWLFEVDIADESYIGCRCRLNSRLLDNLLGFTVAHCQKLSLAHEKAELAKCKERVIEVSNIFRRLDLVLDIEMSPNDSKMPEINGVKTLEDAINLYV